MSILRLDAPPAAPCVPTTPCVCGCPISCHENIDDVARTLKNCACTLDCAHPGVPDPAFIPHDGCAHCSCTSSRRALYAAWRRTPAARDGAGGAR